MSKQIIAVIIIIVIVAGGVWFYLLNQTNTTAEEQAAENAVESVLNPPTLPEIDPNSNPVEDKLPETNPVQKANPFADVYKNPFE